MLSSEQFGSLVYVNWKVLGFLQATHLATWLELCSEAVDVPPDVPVLRVYVL